MNRRKTRKVFVGNVQIGGQNKIVLQSMTLTKTTDVKKTAESINKLAENGCEIARVACPKIEDAKAIKEIKKLVKIPIVADIHFDYKIALQAIESGVDKIRINPGNIGKRENIEQVVKACKEKNIPIRIGVNAGSLEKEIIDKYGYPTADGMVESAMKHIKILEELDFHDIIVSMKASDINLCIEAYEKISKKINYPLHLGITEAGTLFSGTIKSSVGLAILINQNLGDTMRVSLSDDPVEEIKVGKEILKSFGLLKAPTLISCPTCGRIEIDLIKVAKEVEEFLQDITVPIKVSVLGCAVNGPGEAKEADIGIAGSKNEGLLFRKGKIIEKVKEKDLIPRLKEEILKLEKEYLELGKNGK